MEKEYTISDQLILTRDCRQLEQDKARLEDNLERKKREALSAMDLVKKETEKLKEIQELSIKTHDKIREDQIAWNTEKRLAQEELESKQVETTKILNQGGYIKLQAQKLLQTEQALVTRENAVSVRESVLKEREDKAKESETKAAKLNKEAEKLLETNQNKSKELKQKFLEEINKW
jgi:hypothetical protein